MARSGPRSNASAGSIARTVEGRSVDDPAPACRVGPGCGVRRTRRRSTIWSSPPASTRTAGRGRGGARASSRVALGPRPLGVARAVGLGTRPLGAATPWLRLDSIPLGKSGAVGAGPLEVLSSASLPQARSGASVNLPPAVSGLRDGPARSLPECPGDAAGSRGQPADPAGADTCPAGGTSAAWPGNRQMIHQPGETEVNWVWRLP